MPAQIDPKRCDGCRGNPNPPCMRVCPGDVVTKDFNLDRAHLHATGECWDCYACVKVCPRNAIQVELPYALARHQGGLHLLEHGGGGVLWEVRWPDGHTAQLRRPCHVTAGEESTEVEAEVFEGTGI